MKSKTKVLIGIGTGVIGAGIYGIKKAINSLEDIHFDIFDESQEEYFNRRMSEEKELRATKRLNKLKGKSHPSVTNKFFENPFLQEDPVSYLIENLNDCYSEISFKDSPFETPEIVFNSVKALILQTKVNSINKNLVSEKEIQDEFFEILTDVSYGNSSKYDLSMFSKTIYKQLFSMYSDSLFESI